MLALTFIDFDTQLLPDYITLPLLRLGTLANSAPALFTDLRSGGPGGGRGLPAALERATGVSA